MLLSEGTKQIIFKQLNSSPHTYARHSNTARFIALLAEIHSIRQKAWARLRKEMCVELIFSFVSLLSVARERTLQPNFRRVFWPAASDRYPVQAEKHLQMILRKPEQSEREMEAIGWMWGQFCTLANSF